jgi:O-antigen ligase
MPLVVTSSTLFPFIVGKAIYARTIIEVTFGAWLLLVLIAPEQRPKRSWILIAFGVWLVASVAAGFAGVSFQRSMWSTYERMQGIVDLAHWAGFVLVAGSVFRSLNDWKWLLNANLAVSMFASILGLGQNFDVFESSILGASARIESTLGNATYVGAYTMVNIFIALGLIALSWRQSAPLAPTQDASPAAASRAARRRRRRASRPQTQSAEFDWLPYLRVFWISAIVIELWALWLTETRGAIIGLGAGAVGFAAVYSVWGRIERIRQVSYAIMGMVIVVLLLFIVARTTSVLDPVIDRSATLGRVATIGPNDESIKGRITSISAGLQGYVEKPIFGWGPENYLIAWGKHFDAESGVRERFDQAHNKLVEELTTKGAVGLVTYLAIWAFIILVFVRAVKRREAYEQVFVILVGAAMGGFFVQNMFLFDSPVTVLQFVVLVSFFIAEEMQQRQTQLDEAGEQTESQPTRSFVSGLGDRASTILSSPTGGTFSAVVIVAVLGISIFFLNMKPFNAAAAIVQTSDPNINWEQRFGFFEESIDEFPALANYPRLLLLSQVSNNLGALTTEDFQVALALIEQEGAQGLIDEPESWRLHVAMAHFYQVAAQVDVSLLDKSKEHVQEADKLAPKTIEVNAIRDEQERLEAIVAGQ